MSSITYSEVYSNFFTKVEGYDLFDPNLSKEMRDEFLCSWLHSAVSDPYIMNLFSSISITDPEVIVTEDDEGQEVTEEKDGVIEYELKYKNNDVADEHFVQEILGYSMALAWVTPKVNSLVNIQMLVGTSQDKFYSQANHLAALKLVKDDLESRRDHIIAMRGVSNNTYLDGTSPVATSRKNK